MSYARYKDKIFQCRDETGSRVLRELRDTKLLPSRSSSCSDLRECDDSRDYNYNENYSQYSSNVAAGKFVPPNCMVSLLMNQKVFIKKSTSFSKLRKSSSVTELEKYQNCDDAKSDDDGMCSKNDWPPEKELLDDEYEFEEKYEKVNLSTNEELENLRRLVIDLSEKTTDMMELRQENSKLKEMIYNNHSQRQLKRVLSENHLLSKKINAMATFQKKSANWLSTITALRNEYNRMASVAKNAYLHGIELEKCMGDNAVVAEQNLARLATAEKHIAMLEAMLPSMAAQLRSTTKNAAWQQERLTEKLERLQRLADINCQRADAAQKKLMLCEQLVVNLESVRTELRTSNVCYKEAVNFFQNQFQEAVGAGQSMALTIEELRSELQKAEDELERASRWPGSAVVVVQLGRIKGILEEEWSGRGEGPVQALARLRDVMNQLDAEVWDRRGRHPPPAIADSAVEPLPLPSVCDAIVEAHPSTAVAQVQVEMLKASSAELSAAAQVVAAASVVHLQAVGNIKMTSDSFFEFLSSHFECTAKEMQFEFDNCLKTVELNVEVTERISRLNNGKFSELLLSQNQQHKSRVQLLEANVELLEEHLRMELEINKKLETEINFLAEDLIVRCKIADKMFELWESAENALQSRVKLRETQVASKRESKEKITKMMSLMEQKDAELRETKESKNYVDRELKQVRLKCRRLMRHLKNRTKVKDAQNKQLHRVQRKIKGVKRKLDAMRRVFLKSHELLELLKKSNETLCTENLSIREENEKLDIRYNQMKKTIWQLKSSINKESSKSFRLETENARLKKSLNDVNSRLEQIAKCEQQNNQKSASISKLCCDLQLKLSDREMTLARINDQVSSLKMHCCELEEKDEQNTQLIKNLTQKPMNDKSTIIDDEISIVNEYEKKIEQMKNTSSREMADVVRQYERKIDNDNQVYLKNLNMVKETYERDVKIIKNEHSETLAKIQLFQQEEIANLKRLMAEQDPHEQIEQMKEDFAEELSKQKLDFERILADQTHEAKEEKEQIARELAKVTAEKDLTISQLSDQMEQELKLLKKKCRNYLKRITFESQNCCRRMQPVSETENDNRNVSSDDVSVDNMSGALSAGYFEDHGIFQGVGGGDGIDEKTALLNRIAELEEQIMEYNCYSCENASDAEKGIWKERERNNELSQTLEMEVEESRRLSLCLASERQRVSELEEKNAALIEEMKIMVQNKWKVKTSLSEVDLLDSPYESSIEDKLLNDYAELRMEFIQQCGIKHNGSKQSSHHRINTS